MKCEEIWKRARAEITGRSTRKQIANLEIFDKEADIIRVSSSKNSPDDDMLCYKEKNWNDGWCHVLDANDVNAWGVCSTSCGYTNHQV